jgi:hypothetical protein
MPSIQSWRDQQLLLAWTRPRESYQLDDLPVRLLILTLGLVWLAAAGSWIRLDAT